MSSGRVRVEGLKELRKACRTLAQDDAWKGDLRTAGKAAAEVVAAESRRTASSGLSTLSGKAASMGGAAVATIRALAGQTRATVAGGKASVPYFGGWEFGSSGAYRQFPAKAKTSHNIYPAIEKKSSEIVQIYGDHIDVLTKKHFPE